MPTFLFSLLCLIDWSIGIVTMLMLYQASVFTVLIIHLDIMDVLPLCPLNRNV